MRIAVIGTGWVTGMHLDALKNIEGAEVVAIAGRNRTRLGQLCAPWSAKPYESYLEMLKVERPDGVLLTLPPHLHGEVEVACAEYSGAVLVEKPLAQSLEPAQQALAAFRKAGTLVSVGYQNRYRAGVRRVKEFFAASSDKPILVQGSWVGDMPGPAWWRNKAQSGGQFVEQCTHVVDLARYLVGDIETVQSFCTEQLSVDPAVTVESAQVVNARFRSGALGQFATGCFVESGFTAGSQIHLTLASRTAVARFSTWGFGATLSYGDQMEVLPSEPDIFETQARAWVGAWKTGDRSLVLSDYADGLESLKVTLAATCGL